MLFQPTDGATRRLITLPYAGGGDAEARGWASRPGLDIVPVQLPGRGRRASERPYRAMEPLVEDLAEALPVDVPYALYGHSFGAWLGFALLRELRRTGRPLPTQLLVGARGAPHIPDTRAPIANLPRDAFVEAVQARFSGLPEELVARPALLEMYLPPLRADIRILERWHYEEEAPLPVPITVLDATDDPSVAPEHARAWAAHTTAGFTFHAVEGGHFFHRTLDIPDYLT